MALTKTPLNMIASDGGFTMRNRVINGCARVTQRGTASLTGSNQFGQVDRMIGSLAGSSVSGTLAQVVGGNAAGMTFKRGVGFTGIGFTSGYITFRHRIEALNTLDLSGQTVTVSAKIYHDYGSNATVTIGLRKASASDNFSSTSTIGSDTSATVATGTTTVVSGTYTLGSTDGDNGIEIVIYHDSRTVSSKNFVIGDIELQLGSEVGPFERRPIGTELALCQRYYQRTFQFGSAHGINNGNNAMWYGHGKCHVTMRATPTASIISGVTPLVDMMGSGNKTWVSGTPSGQTVNSWKWDFTFAGGSLGTYYGGVLANDCIECSAEL